MEIALLDDGSLRIKGKQGVLFIDPKAKTLNSGYIIYLDPPAIDVSDFDDSTVVIRGPGEYELAGVKISGIKVNNDTVYSIKVDKIEILLGKAKVLEEDRSKVKEHNIVILYNNKTVDPSFATSLAENVIIFYGEKAEESIKKLADEGYKKDNKYQVTFEKLPQEVEEILLV